MKGLIALAVALLADLPQDRPVFRAGTDVVVLDVVVADASGTVAPSLTPADFIVTTKKGARPIVSLEFVPTRLPVTSAPLVLPEPGLTPARPSTNVGRPVGRSFMLAIDVGEIRAGEGRIAMQQVAAFVDALPPEDLVGLVTLPYGTPRVELTTDRRTVRDVLAKTAGASDRYRSCALTLGEAAGISAGDSDASRAYSERIQIAHCVSTGGSSGSRRTPQGREYNGIPGFPWNVTIAEYRMQTRSKLDTLGALAERMSRLSGQKTIVLISEGLFTDRETRADIARFGTRAEAARVRLYSLHLDTPVAEAAYAVPADTHNLDDHLGFNGMADVATVTGGTALRAIARATGPLNQIDREASGYYLLGVETDPSERDGKSVDFKIRVKTPGLDVRARPAFVHASATTAKAQVPPNLKDAIGDTLRWPVDEAAFRINVDVVRLPAASRATTATALMLAEFDGPPAALGFELTDAKGVVVADTFESPVATSTTNRRGALYAGSATLAPGSYRLKMAAIGQDGQRGGVTHNFTVPRATVAAIRMGDIILGAENGSPWRPIATLPAGQPQVGVRVDFNADTADALASVTARLRVGRMGQAGWIADAVLPITTNDSEPLSRSARGGVNVGSLPAGDYVLKVELVAGGVTVTSAAKVIRVK